MTKSKRGGKRKGSGRPKSLPVERLVVGCLMLKNIARNQGEEITYRGAAKLIAQEYALSLMPYDFQRRYIQSRQSSKSDKSEKGIYSLVRKINVKEPPDAINLAEEIADNEEREKAFSFFNKGMSLDDVVNKLDAELVTVKSLYTEWKEENEPLARGKEDKSELCGLKNVEGVELPEMPEKSKKKITAIWRSLCRALERFKKTKIPLWYHPDKGASIIEGEFDENQKTVNGMRITDDAFILRLMEGNRVRVFRCPQDGFWSEEEEGHGAPCTCETLNIPHRHCQICNVAFSEEDMIFVHRTHRLLIQRQNLGWACKEHEKEVLRKAPPAPWWLPDVNPELELK